MTFLDKLVSAIATQEGWFNVTAGIGRDNNNPGNIRPWWRIGNPPVNLGYQEVQVGPDRVNRYIRYPNVDAGIAGIYCDLAIKIRAGMSIPQIIHAWAPPSDGNHTRVYIRNVFRWCGIEDTPVNRAKPAWEFLPELKDPRK